MICLLVNQWKQNVNPDIVRLYKQLERPSLGHWVDTLRKLIAIPSVDDLPESICRFWEQPLAHAPTQLISDANGSGLAWQGRLPRSHLGWLDWFVWLRNVTRGHGAVEEKQVAPLWHGLHETFLQMVWDLRSLVIDSTITTSKGVGEPIALRGWNRTVRGISRGVGQGTQEHDLVFLLRKDSKTSPFLLVYPFMVKQANSVLLWNSVRGNAIEFIDYGSGKLQRIAFQEINPFNLWNKQQEQLQSILNTTNMEIE